MRGIRASIAVALFVAQAQSPATAGAFTLEPGETKLFMLGLLSAGDRYFDRQGKLRSRGKYGKYDLQLSAEHGALDGLTVFGSTAIQKIRAEDGDVHDRKGLGRSEVGARARLWTNGRWIVSGQASAVIAGAKGKEGLATIGETDDQIDIRGLMARSFEVFGKHAFVDVAGGYRFRSGDPADEIRIDASFGVRPAEQLLVILQSFNQIGTARWKGPYPLKQRVHKLQAAALFDLTDNLQLIGAVFFSPDGRDSLDEKGATLGIGVKF